MTANQAQIPEDAASQPPIGRGLRRRGIVRWALMAGVRVAYRAWTRIAAVAFPENSRRAQLATTLHIPLPDALNMSWITPYLAVGGRVRAEDVQRLARSGVTRVVDTRSEYQDDEQALESEGILLLYLPTQDTYPLSIEDLQRGAEWINQQIEAGERVLIHCEHGVGRSVLLTAASLVASGMSSRAAVRLIQRRRWQAAPNHRQLGRLQEFERITRVAHA
jgi:protein tyrosine phosphatase (PTP) superfamily phosphohydrolase (DUF442 family)